MNQNAGYQGGKLTATAQQRDGEQRGAYVREKNDVVFRNGMSVNGPNSPDLAK